MLSLVVEGFVAVLAAEPDAVLPAIRIGDKLPFTASELPSVSVSLTVDPPRGNGMGQFLREGHQLVRNTAIVQVGASPQFSGDLRSLALDPLPLKRNPSSHSAGFSDADVSVRRVTGLGSPVTYRLMPAPQAQEEFALDVPRATLRFGAPQAQGDQLEVVHWTLEFRDDILSVRYTGSAVLDVWANILSEAAAVSRRLQQKLAGSRETVRLHGFAILNPSALESAASILQQPGAGSAFPAWKQSLRYRFAFETELGGGASGGGPIRRIQVDANDEVHETFLIPRAQ
jgi:hypothetical protein